MFRHTGHKVTLQAVFNRQHYCPLLAVRSPREAWFVELDILVHDVRGGFISTDEPELQPFFCMLKLSPR